MPPRSRAVWIISDIHIRSADEAQLILGRATADMKSLDLPLEAVWCLGDMLEGSDLARLETAAREARTILEAMDLPIWYLMGNHDMDLRRVRQIERYPFYERVAGRPGWHTTRQLRDPCFHADWAGYRVYFLGDHSAGDATWFTSHGSPAGMADRYPYVPDYFRNLRQEMASVGRGVLIASHYAFPGGQRPGALHDALLPLPDTVRGHFYGHAHIGDPVWNRDATWQRRFQVRGQEIPEVNVSALESSRSPGSHSAGA